MESDTLGLVYSGLSFNNPSRWFWCVLKFEGLYYNEWLEVNNQEHWGFPKMAALICQRIILLDDLENIF